MSFAEWAAECNYHLSDGLGLSGVAPQSAVPAGDNPYLQSRLARVLACICEMAQEHDIPLEAEIIRRTGGVPEEGELCGAAPSVPALQEMSHRLYEVRGIWQRNMNFAEHTAEISRTEVDPVIRTGSRWN